MLDLKNNDKNIPISEKELKDNLGVNIDILFDKDFNTPLTDKEFKELMKFDSNDIDISTVEFRLSTAEDIAKRYDIVNFMKQ